MKTATKTTACAAPSCIVEAAAAPSLLDWVLDAGAGVAPAASPEATTLALFGMVDLSGKSAYESAKIEIVNAKPIPKGYELIDGAAGFKCIKGKVSKATADKLEAMGARRSMRSGGTWSVAAEVADKAFAMVCEDVAAAPTGCSVCGLHKSQFGKRCPGYKVA
jgi:hypothetical protein